MFKIISNDSSRAPSAMGRGSLTYTHANMQYGWGSLNFATQDGLEPGLFYITAKLSKLCKWWH